MTPLIEHDPRNHGNSPEFCTAPTEKRKDFPLKLRCGIAEKMLNLKRYQGLDADYLIQQAKNRLGDKSSPQTLGNVIDRATAIAVLLGVKQV